MSIFDDPEVRLGMQFTTISGKSPLTATTRLVLTRGKRLHPGTDNGIPALDDIAAERGMRGVVLWPTNCLFVGPEAGGKAAAIACCLVEMARFDVVDPRAWVAEPPARNPAYKITKADDLLPWRPNPMRPDRDRPQARRPVRMRPPLRHRGRTCNGPGARPRGRHRVQPAKLRPVGWRG